MPMVIVKPQLWHKNLRSAGGRCKMRRKRILQRGWAGVKEKEKNGAETSVCKLVLGGGNYHDEDEKYFFFKFQSKRQEKRVKN